MDAAIAVLAANPSAPLGEVALAAGVGRATLYRHFSTREELIDAISLRAIEETNTAAQSAVEGIKTASEKFWRMLQAVVPLGDRFHFIMSEPQSAREDVIEAYQAESAWVSDLVDDLKKEGAINATASTSWAVATIDALIWTAWTELHAGRLAAADAPEVVYRTVLGGLRAPPA